MTSFFWKVLKFRIFSALWKYRSCLISAWVYHYNLSWKTEHILILFLHNVTIYNQLWISRNWFSLGSRWLWIPIYMIHLMLFLIMSYFNWVKKVAYSQSQFNKAQKSACCLRLLVFLRIWIVALFWLRKKIVCGKGCTHHICIVFQ